MYTVFIVDDEALIRDGLKQIIDWEALGFTVCGEASNGEDAEKEILEKQPDLTLMDIRMPGSWGLMWLPLYVKRISKAGSSS